MNETIKLTSEDGGDIRMVKSRIGSVRDISKNEYPGGDASSEIFIHGFSLYVQDSYKDIIKQLGWCIDE